MNVASERAERQDVVEMNALSQPRRSAARSSTQLDLFTRGAPRRQPFTPERLTSIALGVWRASKPVAGTLGQRLFYDLRTETPGPEIVRFCPNLKRGETRSPGLVWLLRLPNGSPCGVVRIYLDEEGRAVERRVLGRAVGATVMPRPP
jgi:hypothetical protein